MWAQGEHVAIVGSTGSGKSYLEARLVRYRDFCLVLRTKADDIRFPGFRTIHSIAELRASDSRVLLSPKYERQYIECAKALEMAWREGGWCVAIDELYYATELKLDRYINRLLTQGRSKHISVICGMQRPSRVTRFALSEITHGFFFTAEGRDIKLIGEATTPRVEALLPTLKQYQFVYFNRKSRDVQTGRAQSLDKLLGG